MLAAVTARVVQHIPGSARQICKLMMVWAGHSRPCPDTQNPPLSQAAGHEASDRRAAAGNGSKPPAKLQGIGTHIGCGGGGDKQGKSQ